MSVSVIEYIKIFNNQLIDLLSYLEKEYPDVVETSMAKNALKVVATCDKRAIIKHYAMIVYPYDEAITKEDRDFFLNKDYSTDVSKVNGYDARFGTDESMLKLSFFKDIFLKSENNSKVEKKLFTVLQLLNSICDEVLKIKIDETNNAVFVKFNDRDNYEE